MKKFFIIIILTFNIIHNKLLSFDGLLFQPLTANIYEPRIGALYQLSKDKIRLDIGASLDLIEVLNQDAANIRIGTDFFTFTRLRSEGKFKFPVETIDYYFGINTTLKGFFLNNEIYSRLRISHISSHLVDGLSNDGRFDILPFIYSREFLDFVTTFFISHLRYYAGFNYTFSTIPKNIKISTPQIGTDYSAYINEFLKFIGGIDFKLVKIDKDFEVVTTSQFGIMLETSKNIGVSISFYQYDGRSIHGMFYDQYDSYKAIGFQIYFY